MIHGPLLGLKQGGGSRRSERQTFLNFSAPFCPKEWRVCGFSGVQICATPKCEGESLQKRQGWGRGVVSLRMITVVGVREHQHILQNLDQGLYLFSFLDIVQPDYQLLQSFLVLLLAPLTAATGHGGLCSKPTVPPTRRPAARGRGRGRGAAAARGDEHSSPPAASAPGRPHPHPRPPVYEEGGGSPPCAALPLPGPPPRGSSSPTQAPKMSSGAWARHDRGRAVPGRTGAGRRVAAWAGPNPGDRDRDRGPRAGAGPVPYPRRAPPPGPDPARRGGAAGSRAGRNWLSALRRVPRPGSPQPWREKARVRQPRGPPSPTRLPGLLQPRRGSAN